jgi:Asp-tRNA(Asn)/Glu-tRNA(Gln) amidotransferase A subunit family amidase
MSALRREGVRAERLVLPFPAGDFGGLQKELCYFEAARLLLRADDPHVSEEAKSFFAPYLDVDIAAYAAAARRRLAYQGEFEALAAPYDAVLMPAAMGAAPARRDTGDAVMSRFWTALQVPAFSVPLWRSADGMPLGLQMLAGLGKDRELASLAQWFHENFGSAA